MKINRLRELFDQMSSCRVRMQDYTGPISDVVFDMLTADAFLAGIATTLIDRAPLQSAHRLTLDAPLLEGSMWVLADGRKIDLMAHPALLQYARVLDDMRVECQKHHSS